MASGPAVNTGIDHGHGHIEMDVRRLRRHYLRRWFAVDVIACLPIRYIGKPFLLYLC